MRPERIVMEGFGTFRERTEVDFEGVDLFALTGSTGAGKSTIIDAIVFALYGTIPRLDDRRVVAPAISQDKVQTRVQLDFSVAGETYTAVRVVRAVTSKAAKPTENAVRKATTKEARLERRVAGGEDEVIAGNADELTVEIERLLGLSFEHFTTCVVLPQGQFARFLHHKPSNRQDLLVELLDLGVYGEMASLARIRQKAAQQQVTFLENDLAGLAFATSEQLADHQKRADLLSSLVDALDELLPELADTNRAIEVTKQQQADVTDCLQRLAGIEQPGDHTALAGEAAVVEEALQAATLGLQAATATLESAEAARELLGERAAVEVAKRDQAERAELATRVAKGREATDGCATARSTAQRSATDAQATLEAAVAALEAARLANRAAELAGYLEPGEPCPVCGNQVHEVPGHQAPALTEAEELEREARAGSEAANEKLAKATSKHDQAMALLAELQGRLTALDQRLAELDGQAFGTVEDLDARLAAIDSADTVLKDAKATERVARAELRAAEKTSKEVEARSAAAWDLYLTTRDSVALLEPPAVTRTDLMAAWESLVTWAGTETERYERERQAIQAELRAAENASAAISASMATACEHAGVDPGRRPARDVAVEALADAKADVESVKAAMARRVELEAKVREQTEVEQVSAGLAQQLKASGFEKWVLDEALQRLVDAATGILFELSGGAYSLLLDARSGNFAVRDHNNADALRLARTLSGGETFLASLALALALADQVAEMAAAGAVRLESIFLDEGFGTLDPDTLDTVATAIEELGSRGRLVGLVSHVRELAERMPVRFEVQKGPSTSTVSRVDS